MAEPTSRLLAALVIPSMTRRPDALLRLALAPSTLINALSTLRFGEAILHPPCLITLLTGRNCPGCGLIRALTQLWLGHFHQALQLNPLSPLVLSLLLMLFSQQLSRVVVYQRQPFSPQPATQP